MRMRIGVSDTFDAAHAIPEHEKCGRVHGHTFKVEVEVEGEVVNGMVMDFFELKKVLWEILSRYDHRLLNEFIENPTSENICMEIFNFLRNRLKNYGMDVVRVRVYEKSDKWAEIRNEPEG